MSSQLSKILILGSFAKGALEHQYVRGLRQIGWNVSCVDIQSAVHEKRIKNIISKSLFKFSPQLFYQDINNRVLDFAKQLHPEIILVFKGMELFPETLVQLKPYTKLLCNYNPDHPFKFYSKGAGNSNVLDSIKHFDLYFSYSQSISDQLIKKFKTESYCIPFGFDETIKPTKRDTPNITNQFLFVGSWDNEREQNINALSDISLNIFGPKNWAGKLNRLRNIQYQDTSLFEQEYADACFNASGIINFLRPQNIVEQSHNMRTFEVPGYGGLIFSERTEEQMSFFEENKEAIYFDNIIELKDKISFYLNHKNAISTIKKNALKRSITSNYTYKNRCEQLTFIINKHTL